MQIDPKMTYINRQKEVSKNIMGWTDTNIERIATSSLGTTRIQIYEDNTEYSMCHISTSDDKPIYTTKVFNDNTFECDCGYFKGKNIHLDGNYKKVCKHIYLHSYFITLVF